MNMKRLWERSKAGLDNGIILTNNLILLAEINYKKISMDLKKYLYEIQVKILFSRIQKKESELVFLN